ncbi:hypothetical protein [Bosea sp. (in: a-proteobacteria)]|uniref:hypothetical protein n=1 Tax=Bosea sp. (in: a-proteobacteria) TaxID=1871050 RepID=UPI00273538F2|nr:hypothetical protein [Bosea sp. (in: a-proteobacteria)]MDP3411146.1 hypothetical protein [Bosea sp. (in: a-proteobacteria)]
MTFKRLFAAIAFACALAVSACVPKDGGGPDTSAEGWRQIAVGVGTVVGPTKADAGVAKASAQLAQYCGALQAVAASATIFAPEKQRNAAAIAAATINTVCASPPADVSAALVLAADTYAAVRAAQAR